MDLDSAYSSLTDVAIAMAARMACQFRTVTPTGTVELMESASYSVQAMPLVGVFVLGRRRAQLMDRERLMGVCWGKERGRLFPRED